MNKYQEALNLVKDTITDFKDLELVPYATEEDIQLLQELEEKQEAKKVIQSPLKNIYNNDSVHAIAYMCPHCKTLFIILPVGSTSINKTNFCSDCGQKLDWSDVK